MSIIDKEEKIMQRTTNYGLCQYEGSDKTSYLVNYNEDMLKIDTAIKNAADAGSGAGTAAERAQGTADSAVEGVSALNTQINGANGLAADVETLQGSVGSISSLIGNGTPTTSNQTIIGAINGMEGAIAPREDGDDLARSYVIGEQFARGGSVYTALTPLTAGTAFASLTLNTNYKNSDTLVEQIADVADSVSNVAGTLVSYNEYVSVTADGVKTAKTLMEEAITSFLTAISALSNRYVRITNIIWYYVAMMPGEHPVIDTDGTPHVNNVFHVLNINAAHTNILFRDVDISNDVVADASQAIYTFGDGTFTYSDCAAEVPADGAVFGIHYEVYKKGV